MHIQYNFELNRWECPYLEIIWGHNKERLASTNSLFTSALQFELENKENYIGPIIGVIVEKDESNQLIGDMDLLQEMQVISNTNKAIIVIFTIQDFYINGVNGLIYSPLANKWFQVQIPLPNVIYNRLSTKKISSEEVQLFFQRCHQNNIPIVNSHFLTIEQSLKLVLSSVSLRKLFPQTKYVHSLQELIYEMQKTPSIILIEPSHTMPNHTTLMERTRFGEIITMKNTRKKIYTAYHALEKDYYYLFHPYKLFFQENKQYGEKYTVLYHLTNSIYIPVIIQTTTFKSDIKKHQHFFEMIGNKIGTYLQKEIPLLLEFSLEIYFNNNNYTITFIITKPILNLNLEERKKVANSLIKKLIDYTPFAIK